MIRDPWKSQRHFFQQLFRAGFPISPGKLLQLRFLFLREVNFHRATPAAFSLPDMAGSGTGRGVELSLRLPTLATFALRCQISWGWGARAPASKYADAAVHSVNYRLTLIR